MSRSPLSYPLNRGADMEVGGAADLQTDVMRFMAILSLCLVAIFALVQSMPMRPAEPPSSDPVETTPAVAAPAAAAAPAEPEILRPAELQPATSDEVSSEAQQTVQLKRPAWVPQQRPTPAKSEEQMAEIEPPPATTTSQAAPLPPDAAGFTLRFASDLALTRLVATGSVGVYAFDGPRARRMTVSESRISFWDASMPNSFHEMQNATVPQAVRAALERSGSATRDVSWGVTLPGKLESQLDEFMQAHSGGALVIEADGKLQLEQD